jgi:hypothetical protein
LRILFFLLHLQIETKIINQQRQTMKKLLLTAGICIASLLSVQAQKAPMKAAPSADQQVDKMMKNMTAACNLTPDQVTKATPIVKEFVSARMANKKQFGSDKDKLKTANMASMKTMNGKLATVLNADQQQKWTAKEQEMQAEKQKEAAGKDKE